MIVLFLSFFNVNYDLLLLLLLFVLFILLNIYFIDYICINKFHGLIGKKFASKQSEPIRLQDSGQKTLPTCVTSRLR